MMVLSVVIDSLIFVSFYALNSHNTKSPSQDMDQVVTLVSLAMSRSIYNAMRLTTFARRNILIVLVL